MRRALAILALCLSSVCAFAQESGKWSMGIYWDLRTKTTSGIVLREVGKINRPFGSNLVLDVDAFAGSDLDNNLLAGFAVGKSFSVAQNVDFKFSVAAATAQNKPTGAGLIAVLTWRF